MEGVSAGFISNFLCEFIDVIIGFCPQTVRREEPFQTARIAWRQSPRRRIEQVVRGICPKRLDFGPARNVKPVGFTVEPRVSNRVPLKIKALR